MIGWRMALMFIYSNETIIRKISNFEKRKIIDVSDIKLEIFRQIDSLDKDRLEEIYGILVNFLHSKNDLEDWEKLTKEQQQGIVDTIEEIDHGKGIAHEKVMDNIRKKYKNV